VVSISHVIDVRSVDFESVEQQSSEKARTVIVVAGGARVLHELVPE
jgi:hypothetical protein